MSTKRGKMALRYKFLEDIAKMDVKKWLEDKLLETKIGYWEISYRDAEYPERIPGPHTQDLPQFHKVEYKYLGNVVTILPDAKEIADCTQPIPKSKYGEYTAISGRGIAMESVLTMRVNDRATYYYVVKNYDMRGTQADLHENLYPILYTMARQSS